MQCKLVIVMLHFMSLLCISWLFYGNSPCSHSSAGESPSRTEQGAGEWLRRQHLDSPGNEMDDSTTPAKFESTKKKAKYVRYCV